MDSLANGQSSQAVLLSSSGRAASVQFGPWLNYQVVALTMKSYNRVYAATSEYRRCVRYVSCVHMLCYAIVIY